VLTRGAWTPDPRIARDVYFARRSEDSARVTFYSGPDSLALVVAPGESQDFIVWVDGHVACLSSVSASRRSPRRVGSSSGPVEIPFTMGPGSKMRVQARVNGSRPLSLLFDTGGFEMTLFPSAAAKRAQTHGGVKTPVQGTGGVTTGMKTVDNRVEITGLEWEDQEIITMSRQSEPGDGILGIGQFHDHVVEIDFDRHVMVLHDSLPADAREHARIPLEWKGTVLSMPMGFRTTSGSGRADVLLDTGSNGTLTLDSAFTARYASAQKRTWGMPAYAGGIGPARIALERTTLPEVRLGDVSIPEVPVYLVPAVASRGMTSIIGLELLRRFHLYIDLRHDALYLKPAKDLRAPYPERFYGRPPLLAIVGVIAIVFLFWMFLLRRRRAAAGARPETRSPMS
jgi:predicted aspartyl protease